MFQQQQNLGRRFGASKMHVTIPPPLAKASVHSKVVVLWLLVCCLMYLPLFVGVLCLNLFCYALLCVHSSFAIILKRKRKLVALLVLSCRCIVTINVLWPFLVCVGRPAVCDCGIS